MLRRRRPSRPIAGLIPPRRQRHGANERCDGGARLPNFGGRSGVLTLALFTTRAKPCWADRSQALLSQRFPYLVTCLGPLELKPSLS